MFDNQNKKNGRRRFGSSFAEKTLYHLKGLDPFKFARKVFNSFSLLI